MTENASGKQYKKFAPNKKRAESIAMRRIVVEMGFWLSPFLKDYPIPVLSEWEKTVDLVKLQKAESHPMIAASDRIPKDYVERKSKGPVGNRSAWNK